MHCGGAKFNLGVVLQGRFSPGNSPGRINSGHLDNVFKCSKNEVQFSINSEFAYCTNLKHLIKRTSNMQPLSLKNNNNWFFLFHIWFSYLFSN